MTRRVILAALPIFILVFASAALAINTTPASNNAIGWFPVGYQSGSYMFDDMNTALSQQGYDIKYKLDTSLSSSPNCKPERLIDYITAGTGWLHIGTHGNDEVLLVATYSKTTSGQENFSADLDTLTTTYGLDASLTHTQVRGFIEPDAYKIYFYDLWVDKYKGYNSENSSSVVYTTACDSWWLSARWQAYSVLSYSYHVTFGRGNSDASEVYNNLNGYGDDVAHRSIGNATADVDSISQGGGTEWVLAPTIISWNPPHGTVYSFAGPFNVTVGFDTEMKTSNQAGVVSCVNGYTLDDYEVPGYNGPRWYGSSSFSASVVPIHCPGPVTACVYSSGAVSAVGEHQLDGGGPVYGAGQGPNRDNFVWEFSTNEPQSACDPWATSFSSCGAFDDDAGLTTTIFWQVEFQRGTIDYDVYAGDGTTMMMVRSVVPAIVDPNRPAGYSITVPKVGPVVEIVERDDKGNETRSRPFQKGERPDNFEAIVNVGNDYPMFETSFEAPPDPQLQRGGGPMPAVQHPWYIFVSSRQDFLNAYQGVINKLTALGRPTDTVLTTKNPSDIWTALYPYWTLWNPGYVRPRIVLIGKAYQDTQDARNILGTYYSPDSTGICYFDGTCVRDTWLVDFDGDHVPDLDWVRVDADNLTKVQNVAQGFLDALNGIHISSPKAFFLDGDLDWCVPITEPDATLQAVRGKYTAHGIPSTLIKDSQFADCYDLTSRQNAAVSAIQSGITEMVGAGYISNRRRSPALLIQNDFSPYWAMSLVPRQQGVVGWFPGCDWGDGDRINTGAQTEEEMWTTAPTTGTQARFWTSHGRGAWGRAHLKLMKEIMAWRFSGLCWDASDVVGQAIRSLAHRNPGLIEYLGTVTNYGSPVALPDFPTMPTITGVEQQVPMKTELLSTRPNPFADESRLWYSLAARGRVTIDIVDVAGRVITRLADETQEAGPHTAIWQGTDQQGRKAAAGVYFVRASLNGEQKTGRMILTR